MKKSLIAIALILLIAVGGVFAAIPVATDAEATLRATVEGDFKHGFTVDGVPYKPTTAIENAFDVDPELVYGFKARSDTAFRSVMTITDFELNGGQSSDDVTIDAIEIDGDEATFDSGANGYVVLEYKGTDVYSWKTEDVTIVVRPNQAKIDAAPVGIYKSTVTIEIAGY